MNTSFTLEQLPEIAKKIIEQAKHKTILFHGEMGMGKTTLIKELVKQLGVQEITNSPTFSLVNEYVSNTGEIIYHFDFYRINTEEEAYDIGIEDYFYNNAWCFIEWPSKVENLVPLDSVNLYLTKNNDGSRQIKITS